MFQSLLKYLFKSILAGIVISGIIASFIWLVQYLNGRIFSMQILSKEFGYYLIYGIVLTTINSTFFDYLNSRSWRKGRRFRLLIGVLGSFFLTILGVFLIRLGIGVVFEGANIHWFY